MDNIKESKDAQTQELQMEISEQGEKVVDDALKVEKWRSFVSGKVTGGLAVLDALDIDRGRELTFCPHYLVFQRQRI